LVIVVADTRFSRPVEKAGQGLGRPKMKYNLIPSDSITPPHGLSFNILQQAHKFV
jgi:hypothetical protein